jgi:hypothetical protein
LRSAPTFKGEGRGRGMQTKSITTVRGVDDDETRAYRRDGRHGRRRWETQ